MVWDVYNQALIVKFMCSTVDTSYPRAPSGGGWDPTNRQMALEGPYITTTQYQVRHRWSLWCACTPIHRSTCPRAHAYTWQLKTNMHTKSKQSQNILSWKGSFNARNSKHVLNRLKRYAIIYYLSNIFKQCYLHWQYIRINKQTQFHENEKNS